MIRACLLALILLVPGTAFAQRCTISATGVSFGMYFPFSAAPTDNAGAVSVTCTAPIREVQISIALTAGENSGGVFFNRRMRARLSFLLYQLYTNASRTVIWGDGSGGSSTVNDVVCRGCGRTLTYPIFGRLPGRQFSSGPGAYTDVITAIVTFN